MENKILKFIGFSAMGLILFVATMVIIRWVVDFVTWSTLDSGWAQVIGSVLALAVAIYVMRQQASFAISTEERALKRQADTVAAIVAKLNEEIQYYAQRLDDEESSAEALFDLKDTDAFFEVLKAVDAIPLYSLGSVKMVRGIFEMQKASRRFKEILEWGQQLNATTPDFRQWDSQEITRRAAFMGLVSRIAYGIFVDGYNALVTETQNSRA